MLERGETVLNRRNRVARAFDDEIDGRVAHDRKPVVRHEGRSVRERCGQGRRGGSLGAPSDAHEIRPRARGRKIGDGHDAHAGGAGDLREVHRAELAGADQADAYRPTVGFALPELCMQVHDERP
jgi:hypothetical protein